MKTAITPRTLAQDRNDHPRRTAVIQAGGSSCILSVCDRAALRSGSEPNDPGHSLLVDLSWWEGPGTVYVDPARVTVPALWLGDSVQHSTTAKQCADVVRLLRAAVVNGLEVPEDLRAALALID